MVSGTFDKGGATFVSGQDVEAFWNAVAHFPLLSVGMNCALGPELMRPHIEALQQVSPRWISCHPNAGLPNEMGQYDLGPADMARHDRRVRRARLGEHHRRLLRHDARAHPRDRRHRAPHEAAPAHDASRRTCG